MTYNTRSAARKKNLRAQGRARSRTPVARAGSSSSIRPAVVETRERAIVMPTPNWQGFHVIWQYGDEVDTPLPQFPPPPPEFAQVLAYLAEKNDEDSMDEDSSMNDDSQDNQSVAESWYGITGSFSPGSGQRTETETEVSGSSRETTPTVFSSQADDHDRGDVIDNAPQTVGPRPLRRNVQRIHIPATNGRNAPVNYQQHPKPLRREATEIIYSGTTGMPSSLSRTESTVTEIAGEIELEKLADVSNVPEQVFTFAPRVLDKIAMTASLRQSPNGGWKLEAFGPLPALAKAIMLAVSSPDTSEGTGNVATQSAQLASTPRRENGDKTRALQTTLGPVRRL
ncbi:uncharacterized protein FIBRA_07576 [Fibroporia radiculosa]|uniref:Uncharacterized protein n=1 Tax=Fibroporia radiculosa TaxID=599839 RepID=J4I0X6_9APHY|nr:uncharacterized protein FIBRA_07576 [Fibroporia radiculosa]CCM05362.1 predicted protein [Fibroporia radiculosa]